MPNTALAGRDGPVRGNVGTFDGQERRGAVATAPDETSSDER